MPREVVGPGDRRDRRGAQLARRHLPPRRPSSCAPSCASTVHVIVASSSRTVETSTDGSSTSSSPYSFATPWRYSRDLRLRGAQPRPVAALGERERVQVAGDVARRARVAVVEPGAADLRRAVEDHDVGDAVAPELDRRGDTAEARADHHDARLRR